ncbi:MAG: hypothetical protein Q4E22_03355 [Coriobacteriia bacterium]|nr:hypothetical protein [Coriobacteriia bacterium]
MRENSSSSIFGSMYDLGKELAKASGPILKTSLSAGNKIRRASVEAIKDIKAADAKTVKDNLIPLASDYAEKALAFTSEKASKVISDGVKKAQERGFNPFYRRTKDEKTGAEVYTEAYTINPDGTKNYESPLVEDKPQLKGTQAKIAGLLLILLGVPMLILPGPGLLTILAGLQLIRQA